ncbi:unnamed protein product [Brassica napus]|uniref:(rape) hypothetical protein n=1 Tax=Brassica napus TaxID=3708 RepID=A0A816LDH6_BRANA|nr:unnamed protein product [Brassica napus]
MAIKPNRKSPVTSDHDEKSCFSAMSHQVPTKPSCVSG